MSNCDCENCKLRRVLRVLDDQLRKRALLQLQVNVAVQQMAATLRKGVRPQDWN